ncbi:1-3-beta-glucan synthase component FKS1 [Apiospora marii]|uniref:1-3-beta-glucan synthase component FKS1 n=1 Tax=Apiospora marii TaxID=335849 RepID=A0ABR1RM63_9PEZI
MKIQAVVAASSLLQLSVAQPRRHGHPHDVHHRRAFIPKRDKVTVTDAKIAKPTEIPEVVVYVDQFGNPVRTATETVVVNPTAPPAAPPVVPPAAVPASPAPQAPQPQPPAPAPAASSAPAPPPAPKPSTSAQPAPQSSAASPVAPPPKSSSSAEPSTSEDKALHGITYSPYKGAGGCKSAAEVDADFALFAKDHGVIRIYGVDCDQVASAYAAAKKYGNKLMLGIFDISSIPQAVSAMASGVKNDWSIVDTVSVGNELVNNGQAQVGQMVGAIEQTRSALRAKGYKGPVVTVDTFVAVLAHPELCDASDYCAVNVHPFFDPNTPSAKAGSFITSTVGQIRQKLNDPKKRIVVTETGWPWKGTANGAAVPGMDTQATAIASIKSSFTSNPADCILFTAFNDMWKKPAAGTFFAEQFWGMGARYSPAD